VGDPAHFSAASGTPGEVRQAADMVVDVTGYSEVFRGDPPTKRLTRDQLVTGFAGNTSWVVLRISLLSLFVVCWLAMLATAVAIVVMTPRCPPLAQLDWWQTAVVYQVDVQSFQDTDNDGVGDLLGAYSCQSLFSR